MRRVILVTGPPCAGKTTHVRQHAQPGDLVLDQDAIGARRMNAALAQVAAMTEGTAWVIRCAPGPTARRALAQQVGATERVHLVEPEPTLVHRAARRPHPRRHIAAVAQWFVREREDRAPSVSRARSKRGTTERGYGWTHQKARQRAVRDLRDGQPCPRCGQAMWRSQAKLLDLDHTDDRAGYRGLAHRACNRRAGQAVGARQRVGTRRAAPAPPSVVRSRNW
jgi:hypothetical protein